MTEPQFEEIPGESLPEQAAGDSQLLLDEYDEWERERRDTLDVATDLQLERYGPFPEDLIHDLDNTWVHAFMRELKVSSDFGIEVKWK